MPIYTLKCIRCKHVQEQGFTVSGFLAQTQQGFRFLSCGRCKRKGVLEHDFIADVRTQVIHNDEYTFGENAPEEGLVNKTVTKSEAKAILKKSLLLMCVGIPRKTLKLVGPKSRKHPITLLKTIK